MSLELDLISDSSEAAAAISRNCKEAGWSVTSHDSVGDYLDSADADPSPLLILSLTEPVDQENGIHDLDKLVFWREDNSGTQLVLVTPEDFRGREQLALKLDARNSISMPYLDDELLTILSKVAKGLGKRLMMNEVSKLKEEEKGFEDIIGVSDKIREVLELARKVGQSEFTSVMITGENGTGKGALAKAIHNASTRASGPFIEVNCAAIPRNLMESEFFGHERGAFTDAKERKLGLFELANGGTIFLDEVGEIDYALQAKLLKFLDSRTIRRVSGTQFLPVDIRIISATNCDLKEAIKTNRFRVDLFYRLNVIEITVPPLRERIEDIRPIAEHYTQKFAARLKKGTIELTADAVEALEQYSWPGNIRELINLIERAVLLNTTGKIMPEELPINREELETTVNIREIQGALRVVLPPGGASLEDVEKGMILAALHKTGGNVTQAAGLLKVERGTLRYKMKKYGIAPAEVKKKIKNGEFEPQLVTD